MSVDRPNNRDRDPLDKAASQHASDPIAKNPKDVDNPGGSSRPAEISRYHQVAQNSANLAKVVDLLQSNEADAPPAPVLAKSGPPSSPPSWPQYPPMQAPPSAGELLTSILRFKWSLIAIAVLISAPIIAAIWTQITPKYQARAEVRVRPIIPRLVFRTDENGMIPLYDSFVNTQVSFIRSLTVLQRVLDQKEIQATEWYKNPPKTLLEKLREDTTPPLERLRDGLSAQPRPRTEIIDVSFSTSSAKEARLVVDTVLDRYIAYIGEKADATEDTLYRQLTDQYKSLETEISGREQTCAKLHESLGTETPQDLVSAKRVRLDETQVRLSELRDNIAILDWQVKQAATVDTNGVVAATDSNGPQPKYYGDAEWRKLDIDAKTLEHRIANSVYGPNHPDGIRAKKDLEFAQGLVRQREAQLDEQWRDRLKNASVEPMTTAGMSSPSREAGSLSVENQLARAKREEQLLQAELERQQTEFKGLFESAQLLEKENNALRQKRVLFDAVRERLDQKNVERNVPGSIEVLTRAYSPSRPLGDRRIVFTVMTLFMGLGLGGGISFLRASRNQTVYAPKDMPVPMQTPFLGNVPVVRARRLPGKPLSVESEPNRSLLNESVRFARTALLSRLDGQTGTTILITSSASGTGKSSFTLMLGKSLAQAGKKVLLIDADFYRMTLSRWCDVLNKPGFVESLADRCVDETRVSPTETPGLSVMSAGQRGEGNVAPEEMANGAFKACIGHLNRRHNFDLILLDSSPILPSADAAILAGQVDGTILVEREHVSHRANLASALTLLTSAGGRLVGTIFVGSSEHHRYGYSYNYSHYYAKGSES